MNWEEMREAEMTFEEKRAVVISWKEWESKRRHEMRWNELKWYGMHCTMYIPMYPSRVVVVLFDLVMGRRMMVMRMRSRMMISHACYWRVSSVGYMRVYIHIGILWSHPPPSPLGVRECAAFPLRWFSSLPRPAYFAWRVGNCSSSLSDW